MLDDVNAPRPRMMSVAYRMLGSVADAEDAVQDAFVRYQGGRWRLLAGGVPDPRHDAPVHRPAAGAPSAGVRRPVRARAGGIQQAGVRPGRLPGAGVPAPAGAADAGRAGGLPAPHRVRLRVGGDRRAGGAVRERPLDAPWLFGGASQREPTQVPPAVAAVKLTVGCVKPLRSHGLIEQVEGILSVPEE